MLLYDLVKVVGGPMCGRTGHVVDIRPNGYVTITSRGDQPSNEKMVSHRFRFVYLGCSLIIFTVKFLNIYRPDLVIQDRVCIDNDVVVKHGPMEHRRGTVKEIQDQGVVLIEQHFGSVASNVGLLCYDSYVLIVACRLYFGRIY